MDELVAIAKIVKPRGLRGEVVADVLTDFTGRFDNVEEVVGLAPGGKRTDLKIENFWFQKDRIILKFAGVDSMDAAEALRSIEVCIPESDVVELEDDEFFDWQLEGCEVETLDGEKLGTVRQLMRTGGTELLVVERDDRELLIPFAEAICPEVDIERKLIRVDPPEGLLEF
jgi:16S rRNA processing protein RimM